jgi:glycosyltransferase involved in cell wall biosynthesis
MNDKDKCPLLTVVIPTFKRPTFIGRAIESALIAAPEGDVEIIVVPNGSDTSWRAAADEFCQDHRIHWSPLKEGNACKARNHGLALASGKYIRFLDDDDYFYPAAAEQLVELRAAAADISSAPVCNISFNNVLLSTNTIPDSSDYLSASLLSVRLSLSEKTLLFTKIISGCWNTQKREILCG